MGGATICFCALRVDDMPLLCDWLNRPAVMRWYSMRRYDVAEVVAKYTPYITGETLTRSFVVWCGAQPIGYIQTYLIDDYPDYSRWVDVDVCTAGVDMFIGEDGYRHRGLGAVILRHFLRTIVFTVPDVKWCVMGPHPENGGAIRAYEKAGFRYLKTIRLPDADAPEYLMQIARADVLEEAVGIDHIKINNGGEVGYDCK